MSKTSPTDPVWLSRLVPFAKPSSKRALIQLVDTVPPYLALLSLMYLTIRWGVPLWVTLALSIPAGLFLVRSFILFHDCCHGSFLKSRRGMDVLGTALGILTFTPYADWRRSHGIHHSTVGNLDKRGIGDVMTKTVEEYEASSPLARLKYRLYRHPFVLFILGPLFIFLFTNRFPTKGALGLQKRSVLLTNLALLAIAVTAYFTIGLKAYLLIQLPTLFIAATVGIWLFYVQHQFDPTYWERNSVWGSTAAAIRGSSYYKLNPFLRWVSGNIGLHHIHHLMPRIPNYNLQACLEAVPELKHKEALTFGKSIHSVSLNLWDEARGKLVSFREAHRSPRSGNSIV
ncbi:fatty acid desaturase DesE [Treponema sp.]